MVSDSLVTELTERLCSELRSRWSQGDRVLVESYLSAHQKLSDHSPALLDLVYTEYLVREESGDQPTPQEYYERFPQLREELSRLFEVHATLKDPAPTETSQPTAAVVKLTYPKLVEPYADLLDTGIIDADRLTEFISQLPDATRPKDLAHLVRLLEAKQLLTPFQSNRIKEGKAHTLRLGEYILLSELGAGGMGQVFKALHPRMDRIVAIKVISPAAMKDRDVVKRFQREVRAAAKLDHPNIVTAYDAGEHHGLPFFVMECVEGRDLAGVVATEGPLSITRAVSYIRQAAEGLVFAHAKGIVHRDIKPANLLLDKNGTIKILDMGLARFDDGIAAKEGLTQSGQFMGTVDYMAPEQAFDTRRADSRVDIYSLGCTLYRLLTGQNMYEAETIVQKMMAHQTKPIPSLAARRPDVPPLLSSIYERMVAKQPDARYSTMAEVEAALAALDYSKASASDAPGPDSIPTSNYQVVRGTKTAAGAQFNADQKTEVLSKTNSAQPLHATYESENLENKYSSHSITVATAKELTDRYQSIAELDQSNKQQTSKRTLLWYSAAAVFGLGIIVTAAFVVFPGNAYQLPENIKNSPAGKVLDVLLSKTPPASKSNEVPRIDIDFISVQDDKSRQEVPLKDGMELFSGKGGYKLKIKPSTAGYLYVFQIDSLGKINWFFPRNSTDVEFSNGANPLQAKDAIQIPALGDYIQLDDSPGNETIYAIFTASQWPELEEELAKAVAAGKKSPAIAMNKPIELNRGIVARGAGKIVSVSPQVKSPETTSASQPEHLQIPAKVIVRNSFVCEERQFLHLPATSK